MNGAAKLDIDECITWIERSIDSPKLEYKYANGEGWEFLIFSASDYYFDGRAIAKIERTTGMILVQLKCKDGNTDIWFGRRMNRNEADTLR